MCTLQAKLACNRPSIFRANFATRVEKYRLKLLVLKILWRSKELLDNKRKMLKLKKLFVFLNCTYDKGEFHVSSQFGIRLYTN